MKLQLLQKEAVELVHSAREGEIMAKVVTLGEIMLRLSPPGYQRFAQASDFEINYGGAEANVAASLAQFGNDAAFVSKIPANAIGDAAVATMKKARC